MANIPCVAALSLLFVCAYGFRVLPVNENPDLIIDEELNLVEPKMDFWNVLLRPKAKTTFKSILKLLNTFDSRDRYSVVDEQQPLPSISHQPAPISTDFIVVKKNEVSIKKDQEQVVIPSEPDTGIVSEEVVDRESLSEEHPTRIVEGSISMESNEKSENSNESTKNTKVNSSQNSDSSKDSSSEETKVKINKPQSNNNHKQERLRQLEALRYEAELPKSLHQFETIKPRYQHSIRDGWIY